MSLVFHPDLAAEPTIEEQAESATREAGSAWTLAWKVLHWIVIAHLLSGALYAGWQVFVVLAPEGHIGPLFGAAVDVPAEQLMARRMYALEAWLASGALAIYLAITEIAPRRS